MEVPLEITYRDVEKTDGLEDLISEKAEKLEQFSSNLISCRVAVERPHRRHRVGRNYRIRIYMVVPPGHELIVERVSTKADLQDPLPKIVRRAFNAAERQLKDLREQQREWYTEMEADVSAFGLVTGIFYQEGYGFLKTLDGQEVYFHKNSVLHGEFDRLEIGTAVRFTEQQGEKGPQASTVEIENKPGAAIKEKEKSVDLFQAPPW